ncbi:hypothetical protein ACXYUI_29330, partial [Klebsiella pneumoniae]
NIPHFNNNCLISKFAIQWHLRCMKATDFGSDFLWGVAISAAQNEAGLYSEVEVLLFGTNFPKE